METEPGSDRPGEVRKVMSARQSEVETTSRKLSTRGIAWTKLRRKKTAMLSLYVLVVLYAGALFAGFVSPYSYAHRNDAAQFHPPMLTSVHIFNSDGGLTRPFVYGGSTSGSGYSDDKSRVFPIRFFVRGDPYAILWVIRSDIHLFGVDEPGAIYLFGSDLFGRDIFSRIMFGSQISLSVGIVGIIISTTIGVLVGGLAGYLGGAFDFVSMRLVEVLLAIPGLYFILILRQTFGNDLDSSQVYFLIVIILSFIGWASEARVVRGMVLALKEREFVLAAQALGLGKFRILIRHILPNTMSFVIVTATLTVPFYILSEVALSFLGVGIHEPEASWGNMLSAAQNVRFLTDFTWILTPGVFILIAVMAWNILGDGLRDAADPRTLG